MPATTIPRRRSAPRIADSRRALELDTDEDDEDKGPRRRGGAGAQQGRTADRMPAWQVALLAAAAVALLMFTLHYSTPAARGRAARAAGVRPSGAGPRCFPLTDTERVKLLGSQNKGVHRGIAAASPGAQALFDLGLLNAWGFERLEAADNFQAALRLDSGCAMCQWGLAYAAGPYPNVMTGPDGEAFPVFSPKAAEKAEEHAAAAARLAKRAAAAGGPRNPELVAHEVVLTELMERRFAGASQLVRGDGAGWYQREREYAEAMAALAEEHVSDPDLFALAAEAYMNLQPWDYYTEAGNLRPHAARAEALLRRTLSLDSRHALALHLHIHAAEAGAPTLEGARGDKAVWAGRALGSADALVDAAPQHGHLLHMPSHIYVRVGLYAQAVDANRRAYDLDVSRAAHCISPYLPEHNVNLLIYAASMGGMLHKAEAFARGVRNLRNRVSDRWMAKGSEWTSLPLVLARYGEWGRVLELDPPGRDARGVTTVAGRQYAEVVYRYVRVLALAARAEAVTSRALGVDDITAYDLAAKGAAAKQSEVHRELVMLRSAISSLPAEPHTRPGRGVGMYASAYQTLARIHGAVAEARVALLLNHTEQALDQLDEAVALEGSLGYMEPPRLHQPARQCLGAVLLRAGKVAEAVDVYHQDLQQHPNNGWALMGLWRAATAAAPSGAGGAPDEDSARQAFQAAWAGAEVSIDSSCPALERPFQLRRRRGFF